MLTLLHQSASTREFHTPQETPNRRPANAGKRYPAEILNPDEVKALILSCSNRAPTGIRNRALIVALL